MEANDRNLSEYEKQWIDTKIAFNRALRSTDNFNAFHWVSRLLRAGVGYLYFKTGLTKLGIHRTGRSYVPFFAVSLVSLVLLSYFTRLRFVILKRWCCDVEMKEATCMENCKWPLLHDFFVSYVGIMILFNYISACFRSPGVALAAKYECFDSSDSIPDEMKWKAADCQGGCCGLNPYLDLKKEKSRASLCIDNGLETHETAGFPTNEWSFCKKCEITRPPRTHHCSICQRCVIRFDHHCVWMNNCIGYNNYRQFLLVLFYLSLGCFYGVAVLSKTFYEPLKRQVEEHGFRILYDYNTGFLDIPPMSTLMRQSFSNTLEDEAIVKLVFPLLLSVGVILTVFFSYHVFYVLSGRTTLDHRIIMEKRYRYMVQRQEVYTTPPNPFDYGWYLNLRLVFGRNFFLALLPIPVDGSLSLSESANKKD